MSGFEKRGHFATAIFERTPVFKWLLLSQTLMKHNDIFCVINLIANFKAMNLNLAECQQVENKNWRNEVCHRCEVTQVNHFALAL